MTYKEKKNQSSKFSPIYKLNFNTRNFYPSNNTAMRIKDKIQTLENILNLYIW